MENMKIRTSGKSGFNLYKGGSSQQQQQKESDEQTDKNFEDENKQSTQQHNSESVPATSDVQRTDRSD